MSVVYWELLWNIHTMKMHDMQQVIVYAMLVMYTRKHSVKYIQRVKLLIYNIKGEGLPATDTDHNEECPPTQGHRTSSA